MKSKRSTALAAIALLACAWVLPAHAGTTGTLAGRIVDRGNDPVSAATVLLVGQRFGAFADAEGEFSILNIPAGTYDVKVSRLGYESVIYQGVVISSDVVTRLDLSLAEATIEMGEVVVTAVRPPVELNVTSTQETLTSEEIDALPVQELQDVVNLQAGVVDGHFRGGRQAEVQYQVDGVSVNDAFDNQPSLKIDRSLLQEVQVISGTFDAEYGQAMSGVVNAVLKQGTDTPTWAGEVYSGAFVFPGNDARLTDDQVRPGSVGNYQLYLSGPTGVAGTVYLASTTYHHFDDFLYGTRRFRPTDRSDLDSLQIRATGDGKEMPLRYSRQWSGVVKLTNSTIPSVKLNYQALYYVDEGRNASFYYRLNPDGAPTYRSFAIAHGFDWTHTLGEKSFLEFSARQNYIHFRSHVFEDVFDPRYDAAGPTEGEQAYELGAFVQGVDFGRYRRSTNALALKGSIVNQVHSDHQVKGGFEAFWPRVEFGTPGHIVFTNGEIVRHIDEPPDYPGVQTHEPTVGAAFVQDQIALPHLTLRAGVRLEFFDPHAYVPSDLANPANAIEGAPPSPLRRVSRKVSLAPRLGMAYPIGEKAAAHFAYGHFYQFPPIGEMFENADYSVLARLQAGGIDYGVIGNPDVSPEKTVQYEFGYKHALTADFGVDATMFYKDVRDLLGVEFITTYADAEYARLTNVDFGNVVGITLGIDHKRLGPVGLAFDYTWQQAIGNSSDPRETATRAQALEDPRPRLLPLNWDQRHTANMTVSYVSGALGVSAVLRAASGQPYTPIVEAGFGNGLETNSGRKPSGVVLDLRAERKVLATGYDVSIFGRVFNVFDTRYFNGAVFNSTGSPYYSRFPTSDEVALADGGRFFPARRVEIGFRVGPEFDRADVP